jgi:hypothetical protein
VILRACFVQIGETVRFACVITTVKDIDRVCGFVFFALAMTFAP